MAISPIRPQSTSPTQPQRPVDATRTAAQRAFFQAALGGEMQSASSPRAAQTVQAPQPTGAAQPQRPVEAPQPIMRAAASSNGGHPLRRPLTEEPPQRIMRPGSFIDIKI